MPLSHAGEGTGVEVAYFGERFEATVVQEPLYDPERKRLRS